MYIHTVKGLSNQVNTSIISQTYYRFWWWCLEYLNSTRNKFQLSNIVDPLYPQVLQMRLENIQEKKLQKVLKSKTGVCQVVVAILIVLTLY